MKTGDRVRKTQAGLALNISKRSNTGTVVKIMRDGKVVVHVDGYAKSTCTGGWSPEFWEIIP